LCLDFEKDSIHPSSLDPSILTIVHNLHKNKEAALTDEEAKAEEAMARGLAVRGESSGQGGRAGGAGSVSLLDCWVHTPRSWN
jgi:hypothetical protein